MKTGTHPDTIFLFFMVNKYDIESDMQIDILVFNFELVKIYKR
jgi:hypothetical protein